MKSTVTTETTAYVLDKQNRIVSTSGVWDQFAAENEGIKVSSNDIYGRSIWDFVAGDMTRIWLDTVLQIARYRGTGIERHYRCDSPDLKRFMRMLIVSGHEGMLRIEHEILSTEQRSRPVNIKYIELTMKNTKQRCSICGRLNIGGWQEPHEDYADASSRILVIYTVCDDCQRLLPGTL